jgi:O-acetyl-ADP-ribose deacetylase (regulator of RNase III)
MLNFIAGNILDSKCYAFVNTVNTVGVIGKGVALQFKQVFPHNYSLYKQACLSHNLKIGELLTVKESSLLMGERLIINFPTKTHWRLPSEYTYIEQGLIALFNYVSTDKIPTVAQPALSYGNGGLDWKKVQSMIHIHLSKPDGIIEIYEPVG